MTNTTSSSGDSRSTTLVEAILERPYAGQIALAWASLGVRVLPFQFVGGLKRPLMRGWPEQATTDVGFIQHWWSELGPYRRGLVGLATGRQSGFWALDIDVKNGVNGHDALAELERQHGPLPRTFTVRTPSGGEQRWFRYPTDGREIKNSASAEDLGPGLDVRGWHGYVVAPGTWRVMASGEARAYEIVDNWEWVDAPEWLVELVLRRPAADGKYGALRDDEQHAPALNVTDWIEHAHEVGDLNARTETSQEWYLFTGLCSLRARNADRDEALRHALEVVDRFPNLRPDEPWTPAHAIAKVNEVWDRYLAGTEAHRKAYHELDVVVTDVEFWDDVDTGSTDDEPESPRVQVVGELPTELLTDLGNARRFARLLGQRVRYVHQGKRGRWLVWDGDRWATDRSELTLDLTVRVIDDIRTQAQVRGEDDRQAWLDFARRCEDVARQRAMLDRAKALRELALTPEQLDRHPALLATPGGRTVNVLTGETRASRPDDLLTRRTNVPYVPTAWSPALQEFLATFMPDPDQADYLFRQLGSTLVGNNDLRHFIIIIGGTTSGKSQFINGVAAALGEYAVPVGTSVFRANQDDKPRPDLMAALPARLAYAEEASQAWELHTDQVKRLTGGSEVVVRGMQSDDMISMPACFTPLVVTNQMPRINGADAAVRRRLVALGFHRSLPPGREDPTKKARFVEDEDTRRALLARLIQGCVAAHQRNGLADMPYEFARDTMEAFESLDHIGEFLRWLDDEGLVKHDDAQTTSLSTCWKASDLYVTYTFWVEQYGAPQDKRGKFGSKEFNEAVRGKGWETGKSNGVRWRGKVRVQQQQYVT